MDGVKRARNTFGFRFGNITAPAEDFVEARIGRDDVRVLPLPVRVRGIAHLS